MNKLNSNCSKLSKIWKEKKYRKQEIKLEVNRY